jgi:hypothetical protein
MLFDFYYVSSFQKIRRNSRKTISIYNERKHVIDAMGCAEKAFKYHSNIDEPYLKADSVVKSEQLHVKQR